MELNLPAGMNLRRKIALLLMELLDLSAQIVFIHIQLLWLFYSDPYQGMMQAGNKPPSLFFGQIVLKADIALRFVFLHL